MESLERGDAAHTAIKKNMPRLIRGITIGEIPVSLYAEEFLDDETWELLPKQITDTEKGQALARDVQKRVRVCPDMLDLLCKILSREKATEEVAEMIHVTYEKELEEKKASGCNKQLKVLRSDLEALKTFAQRPEPPENLEKDIQKSIRFFINTSLEESVSFESLKQDLTKLHNKESLISRDMYRWATAELQKAQCSQSKTSNTMALATTTPKQFPTLFSPSTLYHASLCCDAVSTCRDEASVHRFFEDGRHKLREVSICQENSSENLDRYLIARNGDMIYVAFRSEAKLSKWLEKYNTFEKGIEKQAENIPVCFFLEQMLKQQKVILTGFSFGGMLACSIAAKLWSIALDPGLLQRNLCCITFGQPVISIPYVQKIARLFPRLEQTIHQVLNKEDIIPGLMHYHAVGCTLKGISQQQSQAKQLDTSVDPEREITDFRGPFSSKFLASLCILQDMIVSYSKALKTNKPEGLQSLTKLKELLQTIVSQLKGLKFKEDTCGLMGSIHMMMIEGENGLVWKSSLPRGKATDLLLSLDSSLIDKMDTSLFKKHNMESYKVNTCQTFLHKYKLPPPSSTGMSVQNVSILRPRVESVEFHMYPDLHVVVLQGENLWFCHKIKLGKKGVTIKSPANVMRRSVQYNFPPSPKTEKLANSTQVHVLVQSHFAPPKEDEIATHQEPFVFTLRQKQLARHTPTELIQLAYYTAMLERPSPCLGPDLPLMSKRFEAVKDFLEEAAKIVPLESVFYAIAYSDDDTALQCTKALQVAGLNFPGSLMMYSGSQKAADRVCLGEEYQKQATEAETMSPYQIGLPLSIPAVVEQRISYSSRSQTHHPSSGPRLPSQPAPSRSPPSLSSSTRPMYSDIAKTQPNQPTAHHYQQSGVVTLPVVQVAVPVPTAQPTPLDFDAAVYIQKLSDEIMIRCRQQQQQASLPVLSSRSIEHFCPFSPRREVVRDSKLRSPVRALIDARTHLMELVEELTTPSMKDAQSAMDINHKMLDKVKDIQKNVVKICAALLAAFMEQQIQIPLLSTDIGTAKALSAASPVAMGAWAFVSMGYRDIQAVLSSSEGQSFLLEIEDYISTILQHDAKEKSKTKKDRKAKQDLAYADKLGFLVGGIKQGPTVTCSTQYISYSLERQLKKLSEQLKFDKSVSVRKLEESWGTTFKDNALSLVAKTHRPLIARWLKWALLTHDLRETLASYLCVGVIGISNSGKSLLVNTLFKTQAQVGSTQSKKTVVPFLYNLEGKVDNLDIVDFPGIDDKHNIPELASLLVTLAQVVICVVNYKSVNAESLTEWLCRLEKEDIPVLVCLTHADLLCDDLHKELGTVGGDEHKTENKDDHKTVGGSGDERKTVSGDDGSKTFERLSHRIELELNATAEVLCSHHVPSRTLRYCCFNKQSSHLSMEELKKVGVGSFEDVGAWLVTTIRDKLDQPEIATKLRNFLEVKDVDK